MENLAAGKCVACRQGEPVLSGAEIEGLLPQVQGWQVREVEGMKRLEKVFKFKNFAQALKDEMRQAEGDPRVKARLRSLMRQLATNRMMAEVATADGVITNPTHFAVALKYDGAALIAPQVVAKGQGFIALKIIALAQEAGVPRVENRSLARSLYRLGEVGEVIPPSLYRAVAEVLAYIYGLRAQAGGG